MAENDHHVEPADWHFRPNHLGTPIKRFTYYATLCIGILTSSLFLIVPTLLGWHQNPGMFVVGLYAFAGIYGLFPFLYFLNKSLKNHGDLYITQTGIIYFTKFGKVFQGQTNTLAGWAPTRTDDLLLAFKKLDGYNPKYFGFAVPGTLSCNGLSLEDFLQNHYSSLPIDQMFPQENTLAEKERVTQYRSKTGLKFVAVFLYIVMLVMLVPLVSSILS